MNRPTEASLEDASKKVAYQVITLTKEDEDGKQRRYNMIVGPENRIYSSDRSSFKYENHVFNEYKKQLSKIAESFRKEGMEEVTPDLLWKYFNAQSIQERQAIIQYDPDYMRDEIVKHLEENVKHAARYLADYHVTANDATHGDWWERKMAVEALSGGKKADYYPNVKGDTFELFDAA